MVQNAQNCAKTFRIAAMHRKTKKQIAEIPGDHVRVINGEEHPMDAMHVGLLLTGSIAAGAVNALAGGGSLVTLPILLAVGLPPATANATNAVAAWSGLLGGTLRYRETLAPHGPAVWRLAALSLAGGVIGGGLMLLTPDRALAGLMPWLILVGTLCFLFSPWIVEKLRVGGGWDLSRTADLAGWRGVVQFLVAVVTGYFNPCGGVMMVAAFAAFGIDDIRLANGLKIVMGMLMTGASVALFAVAGAVDWPIAGLMILGTVAGGWLGATVALVLDRRLLRGLILAWGGVMSAVFLVHM
jgi:uncharacterized protein